MLSNHAKKKTQAKHCDSDFDLCGLWILNEPCQRNHPQHPYTIHVIGFSQHSKAIFWSNSKAALWRVSCPVRSMYSIPIENWCTFQPVVNYLCHIYRWRMADRVHVEAGCIKPSLFYQAFWQNDSHAQFSKWNCRFVLLKSDESESDTRYKCHTLLPWLLKIW